MGAKRSQWHLLFWILDLGRCARGSKISEKVGLGPTSDRLVGMTWESIMWAGLPVCAADKTQCPIHLKKGTHTHTHGGVHGVVFRECYCCHVAFFVKRERERENKNKSEPHISSPTSFSSPFHPPSSFQCRHHIVSSAEDCAIRIWSRRTGRCMRVLQQAVVRFGAGGRGTKKEEEEKKRGWQRATSFYFNPFLRLFTCIAWSPQDGQSSHEKQWFGGKGGLEM